MNREIAKENLSLLKSILDKYGITFWLAWGTCLGAIREKNFIANDEDTDVEIYIQDCQRVIALLPELKTLGFQRIPWSSTTIRLRRKKEDIDIFLVKPVKKGNDIIGWITDGDLIEVDFFSELDQIKFLGEIYRIPKNPIAYLLYLYGPTWQQPIDDFWDYHNKMSRQWSKKNWNIPQENLRLIKEIFDRHGIRFFLAKTTCLDLVISRQASDDDIGIMIGTYITEKGKILAVMPDLYQLGFEPFKVSSLKRWNTVIIRNGEKILIEIMEKPGLIQQLKGYRWICRQTPYYSDFFSQLESVEFLGEKYPIPQKYPEYLAYLYGASFWQEAEFQVFNTSQKLALLTQKLQQEGQIEISLNQTWLKERYRPYSWTYHLLTPYHDRITVKKIDNSIQTGMIVLVEEIELLSIKRVVEVTAEGKVLLTSDFRGDGDILLAVNNIIGQVTTLHTRWGFSIPLSVTALQLLFLGKPLLKKIHRFAKKIFS
ncbi:LicD family protein [Limnofasciculus baicalensis]|uniref:LicD family protein n=1 Tax=Limnofasciculus baicalensis BBK-W-15 TaxID=2699891 RepID=A0AAE3GPD3_9CYAN|nr:LicD family protein [Limnofasciculus baicalensis]MCP2727689.1 LicD family protein [Limnofasciculus baicalensis BBK-W-15]